jgi:SAM-dependent methyltransferase
MPDDRPRLSNHAVLLDMLPLAGRVVIDVGCGDGRLARTLAEAGAAEVIGLECSARQLAKAGALPPHDRVSVREGVAEAMPLPDASAGAVVFFNSLHHVPLARMAAALAEAARVLAPGGLCYIGEPVAEGPFFEVCRPVDDETEARAAAQRALRAAPDLRILREQAYIHEIRLSDFAAFRDRLTSANAERDAYFDRHAAAMQALFESRARRDSDGAYLFDQPGLAVLLERTA